MGMAIREPAFVVFCSSSLADWALPYSATGSEILWYIGQWPSSSAQQLLGPALVNRLLILL